MPFLSITSSGLSLGISVNSASVDLEVLKTILFRLMCQSKSHGSSCLFGGDCQSTPLHRMCVLNYLNKCDLQDYVLSSVNDNLCSAECNLTLANEGRDTHISASIIKF